MKNWLVVLLLSLPMMAWALEPVEGRDYQLLPNVGATGQQGQVIVQEFFWYGCPHCYSLEPHVSAWKKTLPDYVQFERVPAALNPVWEASARGFYVAEALGVLDKTHDAHFAMIHVDKQRPYNQKSLAKFYSKFGVKESNFNGLYNSFAINGKIVRSQQLAKFYQLSGVPAMVVNGKYLVPGETERTLRTVNALIAKERARK